METQRILSGVSIELQKGDITELDNDAIVNAANSSLILGAGVAGAIARKGGPTIQEECNRIGGTPVGTAVITGGGNLKAKHVIHAVGPQMGEGNEDQKLCDATRNSLVIATKEGLTSIALPAISTGIFGFPMDRAAQVMMMAVINYLENEKTSLKNITFCLFDEEAFMIFQEELQRQIPKNYP